LLRPPVGGCEHAAANRISVELDIHVGRILPGLR
jgi:hypothetical protein